MFKQKPKGEPGVGQRKAALWVCACVWCVHVCTCVCVGGEGWFQCPRQREMHVRGPKVGNCKY